MPRLHSVTRDIDDIRHYWILQTQEYMDLCDRLPAGDYIHHRSNDYLTSVQAPTEAGEDLREVVNTNAAATAVRQGERPG